MYKTCYISTMFILFSFYGANAANECKTRGRFPNNVHSDCRGYRMCLVGASGFTNYDLLCPENSIYSHLESQCTNVTSYQCLPAHNCVQEGDFVNPTNENCTTYIACVKDLNNIITARLVSCKPSEIFSATDNVCVNETLFNCNVNIETPKVLHVSIDDLPGLSGNFSLNNAACLRTLYMMTISFITLIILK